MKTLIMILALTVSSFAFAQASNKSHFQKYTWDFAVDGGAVSTIELSNNANKADLPVGAIVKNVTAVIKTALASPAGASTISWGNGDAVDNYSGTVATTAMALNTVINGYDYAASALWDDSNDHPIYVYVDDATTGSFNITIGTAAMTAGKIDFLVEYLLP